MVTLLSLDPFTRDLWGEFDAYVRAQLSAFAYDPCFRPKLYVAPDLQSNNLVNRPAPNDLIVGVPGINGPGSNYVEYGLTITPGAIIVGTYLFSTNPENFLFQMTDVSLDHQIFDQPVPAWFISNAKGDFPNLWDTPHPVVGNGLFRMEFWNQTPNPQVIQVVFAVLEPCDPR